MSLIILDIFPFISHNSLNLLKNYSVNVNYTDIAESINKEFTPQCLGILEDTAIFPLNKLLELKG